MNSTFSKKSVSHLVISVATGFALLASASAMAAAVKVNLTGAEETPAITTKATGTANITVGEDKSISGTVATKDLVGTAAHIHLAAVGKSGPPVVSLTKTSDDLWTVPAGSKLSDEQYASYKAGDLYVNVHSAENKKGEIRGQIKP